MIEASVKPIKGGKLGFLSRLRKSREIPGYR